MLFETLCVSLSSYGYLAVIVSTIFFLTHCCDKWRPFDPLAQYVQGRTQPKEEVTTVKEDEIKAIEESGVKAIKEGEIKTIKEDDEDEHILWICTKCNRQKSESPTKTVVLVTTTVGNEPGKVPDIEDIIPLQPQEKSGRKLYDRIIKRHTLRTSPADTVRRKLVIRPVDCLSTCDNGNVVAYSSPGKYYYQFNSLDQDDEEVIENILDFAKFYTDSEMGFSKAKMRPRNLKSNCSARIPPVNYVYNKKL
ncbi:hypothetical protein K7432_013834 [Basidiobolus ranarum]|uniref:Uncharacterized protein n=1 Tax=Basidiobolus ranarum TaxID=34480 RepID=A0ABR2VR21_9FUNG